MPINTQRKHGIELAIQEALAFRLLEAMTEIMATEYPANPNLAMLKEVIKAFRDHSEKVKVMPPTDLGAMIAAVGYAHLPSFAVKPAMRQHKKDKQE